MIGEPTTVRVQDVDATVVQHPFEAAPREEANMTAIEQPTLVVVEVSERNPRSGVPMGEVRDTGEYRATRRESRCDLRDQ